MPFTKEERRLVNQYHPVLGNNPPGIDLATVVERVAAKNAGSTRLVTADTTAGDRESMLLVRHTAPVNIVLPPGDQHLGLLDVKDRAGLAATHNITITAAAGETIDGGATHVVADDYASRTLKWFRESNGTGEWSIV